MLLREAVAKHSRIRLNGVRLEDRLAGELGYDSLAFVNLVLDLEDRLGIEVEPAEFAGLREVTFRDLLGVLERSTGPTIDGVRPQADGP